MVLIRISSLFMKMTLVIDSCSVLGVALVIKNVNSLIYGLIIAYLVATVNDKAMDGLDNWLIMIDHLEDQSRRIWQK